VPSEEAKMTIRCSEVMAPLLGRSAVIAVMAFRPLLLFLGRQF